MVFGLCSQRERLYSLLYTIQIFILTGVVYYYFQGSLGKTAPAHELAVESSQPIGETLRPVWGPMDKCYPVTAQRRRVRSGKKHDSEAMTPKAMGAPNDAAPKEESAVLSREEGQVGPPGEEPASLIPVPKGMTEKEEVARTPGWQENKKVRKEMSVYVSGKTADPSLCSGLPCSLIPGTLQRSQIAELLPDPPGPGRGRG
ncbi:uncharacterized protein LOC133248474 isoform X1 [Bos javanicus]|uniref:uncharacterized protein LOC133248474 isoform X1 n=1 Tax=Bos javanicus TaxID=9906 RepID=UPI002AA7599A|nr:uncharacterized protein LOC133248474 isoform X1 [Bos javanicus]XP_061274708.1 uncharacterized protein LOC133248474 isoform X1 [Bos javanicus]XP_061274709.1 uncharacterized protein LOC133248474 isoform X1 [Bos javanicus]